MNKKKIIQINIDSTVKDIKNSELNKIIENDTKHKIYGFESPERIDQLVAIISKGVK